MRDFFKRNFSIDSKGPVVTTHVSAEHWLLLTAPVGLANPGVETHAGLGVGGREGKVGRGSSGQWISVQTMLKSPPRPPLSLLKNNPDSGLFHAGHLSLQKRVMDTSRPLSCFRCEQITPF